jgi:hypothetical protein
MSDNQEIKVSGTPQISEMIEKLLDNPELIGMVASAVGKAPKKDDSRGDEGEAPASASVTSGISREALTGLMSSLAPAVSSHEGSHKETKKSDRRDHLLIALKPYMCSERCEAIDYMIRLGKISELIKSMGREGGG